MSDEYETECPVCKCYGEGARGYERFRCDGIAEAHHAEGERAATQRIVKWLRDGRPSYESNWELHEAFRYADVLARAIERGEHNE